MGAGSTVDPAYSIAAYSPFTAGVADWARTRIYSTETSYIREGGEMTKRLIDLDDDLLAAAQKELKTSGVSDTVRIALQQAAAASARARQIAWLKSGGMGEMTDPGKRGDVWR